MGSSKCNFGELCSCTIGMIIRIQCFGKMELEKLRER